MNIDSKPSKRFSPRYSSEPSINANTLVQAAVASQTTPKSSPTAATNPGYGSDTSDGINESKKTIPSLPVDQTLNHNRTRRFSATCSPSTKLVSRISQLKQEEGADVLNREMNHEREVLTDMQISQSCEDLNIVTEGWSMKGSDDSSSNSANAHLPVGNLFNTGTSTPSPLSRRTSFTTRRSMSPVTIRPSSLKRKFEVDDVAATGLYSPPLKKILLENQARSPSMPMRQTPSPLAACSSPDSGVSMASEGRITPKQLVPRLILNRLPTDAAAVATGQADDRMDVEEDTS